VLKTNYKDGKCHPMKYNCRTSGTQRKMSFLMEKLIIPNCLYLWFGAAKQGSPAEARLPQPRIPGGCSRGAGLLHPHQGTNGPDHPCLDPRDLPQTRLRASALLRHCCNPTSMMTKLLRLTGHPVNCSYSRVMYICIAIFSGIFGLRNFT